MNLIQYLAALNAVALTTAVGSDVAQCNVRSPIWMSPSLCTDTATELSKCSDSQIISAHKYEMFDGAWTKDEDKLNSVLTTFMTWASLTRDVEMQKEDLCEVSSNGNMPWDIQMCDGDLKLVHRTEPILGHSEYNFDPSHDPAMSGKETRVKSRFGLPSEKVRNFVSLLKPHPMHWRKIPAELYI